LADFGRA